MFKSLYLSVFNMLWDFFMFYNEYGLNILYVLS